MHYGTNQTRGEERSNATALGRNTGIPLLPGIRDLNAATRPITKPTENEVD